MLKKGLIYIVFILVAGLIISSCRKDEIITDSSAKLSFSTDTVMFDTVFTTIGSTTRQLKVYNPYDQPIKISNLFLAGGSESFYRLNINGKISTSLTNVEIAPDDSLFIFVEVNIDPTNMNNPMVVQDSIVFVTNGNRQDIDLVAYGQDVLLINGQFVGDTVWTNDKPVLVYNSMAVDSNCTLTIMQGAKVHFHKNSYLYVYPTASLVVNGTLEEPVIFRGDRLDHSFDDVPGQWGGIHLTQNSKNNVINYAEIINAVIGIRADSLDVSSPNPTLTITNSKIMNMSYAGILGAGSTILATNCVVYNCGFYAVALLYGGAYEFYHCTIFNYWSQGSRTTPSVILNNYFYSGGTYYVRHLVKATFGNCIIFGNQDDEIALDPYPGAGDFIYKFDYSLLKYTGNVSDPVFFNNVYLNEYPEFADFTEYDFELDTLSFPKDKGSIDIGSLVPLDFKGASRTSDTGPDLGAFERLE
ncbi:MAG: hypothetical protein A2W91_20095 [Bacteroidetes bacterium GWF2_38_335]|nr:MAG: hypothetical protein A2W91_20095 [Bacteroidetes bacterium GWF2_38_335]OFY81980.1 MAG: hypothetical protein A2281_09825 [Bacteroidetes bacterium RIFOXYA12_FULL_38_20]HBS86522.1 hypothetical protein [Bacteroidales bacterium]